MLSFATEFPVEHSQHTSAFLRTATDWILGSPHSALRMEDFARLEGQAEGAIHQGNEQFESLMFANEDHEHAGIRYTKNENGLVWITTAVFSRTAADSWVSVSVLCESDLPLARLPPAKKPILVRMLFDRLRGAKDGALSAQDMPHYLENSDIQLAARLMTGQSGCHLPVVYISAGHPSRENLAPTRLASDLAGLAHVVVEPNRAFSFRLRIDVESANVYGGTIGIYWPNGSGRSPFFVGRDFPSMGELGQAILEEIRNALANRRAQRRCSWGPLYEAASRRRHDALRVAGSEDLKAYIEAFDKDQKEASAQLRAAEGEIGRLRALLHTYELKRPHSSGVVLPTGIERDYYRNEILGIVRAALIDANTRVQNDSRRGHVLAAILGSEMLGETAEAMRDKLKELLRGYRSMDSKVRRGLEDLGFEITEDGKHYKLVFMGDDRYVFPLPKSGSDHRGGLNAATKIASMLF